MTKIHPTAIVGAGAELHDDVEIGAYCIIGDRVKIGAGTNIQSHVVIEGVTELGENNVVHPFAVLGGPPQHTAYNDEHTRLVIGDRNLIREHVTMHTGTPSGRAITKVGSDGFFMASSHVGHDSTVGDHVTMAHGAVLGGHAKIDDFVILGGLSAVHQNCRVGRYAFVGGCAAVAKDVIPYGSAWGNHAHLEGLNLIGLKRQGFTREVVNDLRTAYRMLFADEGTFQERVEDVARVFAGSERVREIIDFIQADAARPLCLPHAEV
jgi:UDP-N-acetylglucosamine acyltransferase